MYIKVFLSIQCMRIKGIQGDRSSATTSLIEVGPTDKFPMIVVKRNVIVFESTRTLNAVDSVDFHAWN